ncbi:hypothetical protein Nmel_010859 [Mimus melanotis]
MWHIPWGFCSMLTHMDQNTDVSRVSPWQTK